IAPRRGVCLGARVCAGRRLGEAELDDWVGRACRVWPGRRGCRGGGRRGHRQAVEDAIWAANRAAMDYLATRTGFSRIGHHDGRAHAVCAHAHDQPVASFFQHDSREHDQHLHIHNAILKGGREPTGCGGPALYAYKPAAGAVGEHIMEAHLSHSLGVRFATRPDGKAREIVGIPAAVMELFSPGGGRSPPAPASGWATSKPPSGSTPFSLAGCSARPPRTPCRAKTRTGDSDAILASNEVTE